MAGAAGGGWLGKLSLHLRRWYRRRADSFLWILSFLDLTSGRATDILHTGESISGQSWHSEDGREKEMVCDGIFEPPNQPTVQPILLLDFLLLNFSPSSTLFSFLSFPWIHSFSPALFLEVTKNSYAFCQFWFASLYMFYIQLLT